MKCEILKSKFPTPKYATSGSAGFDLYNRSGETIIIPPGMNALIPTGIYLKLPTGTVGLLTPRSGKAFKSVGFSVANAPGIIDEDFPDEMKVIACNYGNEAIQIDEDERMAQLVVVPYIRCEFEVVDKLSHGEDNERKGGFGHTGAK